MVPFKEIIPYRAFGNKHNYGKKEKTVARVLTMSLRALGCQRCRMMLGPASDHASVGLIFPPRHPHGSSESDSVSTLFTRLLFSTASVPLQWERWQHAVVAGIHKTGTVALTVHVPPSRTYPPFSRPAPLPPLTLRE